MKTIKFNTTGLLAAILFSASLTAQKATDKQTPAKAEKVAPQTEMRKEKAQKVEVMETEQTQRKNPMVGGAEMSPKKNIVENAVNSKDHTTLIAAVKAGGLVETLSGKGPFTVFAPTNEAFEKLPEGTVASLLKEENKKQLQTVLTYHVIPGKLDSKAVLGAIKAGDGKAEVKTVAGETLTLTTNDGKVYITDTSGNKAMVTIADVYQSNGLIHVINGVLVPKM